MYPSHPNAKNDHPLKSLLRSLRVTADDLDLLRDNRSSAVLHLEGDILDKKGPHLVAEAVGIQGTLEAERNVVAMSARFHLSVLALAIARSKSPSRSCKRPASRGAGLHLLLVPYLE